MSPPPPPTHTQVHKYTLTSSKSPDICRSTEAKGAGYVLAVSYKLHVFRLKLRNSVFKKASLVHFCWLRLLMYFNSFPSFVLCLVTVWKEIRQWGVRASLRLSHWEPEAQTLITWVSSQGCVCIRKSYRLRSSCLPLGHRTVSLPAGRWISPRAALLRRNKLAACATCI